MGESEQSDAIHIAPWMIFAIVAAVIVLGFIVYSYGDVLTKSIIPRINPGFA